MSIVREIPTLNPSLEHLLKFAHRKSYNAKKIIIHEGDVSSSLYYIIEGSVSVLAESDNGEEIILAQLNQGDFFGEVSLLTGRPRTATITAKGEVTAIELARDDIDDITASHPGVLDVLRTFYERRAQQTVEAVINRMRDQAG